MNFRVYIKSHIWTILYFVLIFIIINLVLISSNALAKSMEDIIYLDVLIAFLSVTFITFRYIKWKMNYKEFYDRLHNGKDIDLVLPKEECFEGKLIKDAIDLKNKENYKETSELKKEIEELNDYITKWVHEIKLPISVCELIADRIEEDIEAASDVPNSLRGELARIRFLVEQVLYAGRAASYSEDLLVNEINIKNVVKDVIKKNSFFFISKRIDLKLDNLDYNVMTDKKWIAYILEQIINNACKYVEENGLIEVYAKEDDKAIRLFIKDNGTGILPKDINRVFDKGFTGDNGRKAQKSTGMGLYFSKKMAAKLNHDIEVTSKVNEYTEFCIVFYKLGDYFKIGFDSHNRY